MIMIVFLESVVQIPENQALVSNRKFYYNVISQAVFMNKRGVEEAGPHVSVETIIWTLLSVAVLIFLIMIFTRFVK